MLEGDRVTEQQIKLHVDGRADRLGGLGVGSFQEAHELFLRSRLPGFGGRRRGLQQVKTISTIRRPFVSYLVGRRRNRGKLKRLHGRRSRAELGQLCVVDKLLIGYS